MKPLIATSDGIFPQTLMGFLKAQRQKLKKHLKISGMFFIRKELCLVSKADNFTEKYRLFKCYDTEILRCSIALMNVFLLNVSMSENVYTERKTKARFLKGNKNSSSM